MLPELRTDLSGPIFMENGATSTYFMPNLAKDTYFYAKRDRWGGWGGPVLEVRMGSQWQAFGGCLGLARLAGLTWLALAQLGLAC